MTSTGRRGPDDAGPVPNAGSARPAGGARPDVLLVERVRRRLAAQGGIPTRAAVAAAIRSEGRVWGDAELHTALRDLTSEITGAGPLEPLLREPGVTDVLVNGPDEVWADRGDGLHRVPIRFPDEAAVRRLAQRLAAVAGRRIDDASPYVDGRLPDGTRLHAVLPPIAVDGTCLSLRVPRAARFSLAELEEIGSVPAGLGDVLRAIITARLALLVSGGTGTGKTTLLGALLAVVSARERIVLVEEAGELRPDCGHVIRLEARPANAEGTGAVTLRDLVRQGLRMRPDRLVVGEVRGAEVVDLLAALNTGHEGGAATVHANSADDVPPRLEALAALAGLGRDALHSQLAAAVRVVLHLARGRDGRRRLDEIRVLHRSEDGLVRSACAVRTDPDGRPHLGAAAENLRGLLAGRGEPVPLLLGVPP